MADSLVADSWLFQEGVTMSVLQNPLRTHIEITGKGEKFYVAPHWHATHDENHVVLLGRVILTQDGVRRIIGPEDGVCFTPHGVVHSLEAFPGEELILEETSGKIEDTEQKTYFFRSICVPGIQKSPFRALQVLYHADTYPKFPAGLRWLEQSFVQFVTIIGGWMAPMLGYTVPDKRLNMSREKKN
ncbi:hypothetical protein K438DRAFT_1929954 [Mycena galopus ATCC 62051]|nr:hypothetical protein K438DRAFT_1929954 [Mycena galopus ATCC 62051]